MRSGHIAGLRARLTSPHPPDMVCRSEAHTPLYWILMSTSPSSHFLGSYVNCDRRRQQAAGARDGLDRVQTCLRLPLIESFPNAPQPLNT